MGYLTNKLVAGSTIFQGKVELSLLKLAESKLADPDPVLVKMARSIVQNRGHDYYQRLATALAIDGLDLDSTDAEIDSGIVANLALLKVMTGADQ